MADSSRMNEASSAALGIFDGVHLGHRAVISRAVELAHINGISSAVFTFDTATVTSKGRNDHLLPVEIKHSAIKELGVEEILSLPFESIRDYTAEEFVREILCEKLNARYAVCGEDFRFGRNASGNVDTLKEIGGRYNIEVDVVPAVKDKNGRRVSSTDIRKMLACGDIKEANILLGSPYSFKLKVENGFRIGRTLNFPTVNQYFEKGQAPLCYGVYASRAEYGGKSYPSVTNIGMKPTVANTDVPLAETHIIGFEGDIYGEEVKISLLEYIRPEIRFECVDDLKKQIALDVRAALETEF
ncbi:MAG: riboflavin biosynthesis protein RibF [Oscillospiraceae bacterium]|nr:riboflavin biosynthesis protein RibF [Oscillospiraceae bacterium]